MPTLKQKKAADILARYLKEDKLTTAGKVLIEAGYSREMSKHPKAVLDSKGFKEYLATIDERPILEKWYEWALSSKDKRAALKAGENIITLKDRWPKHVTKILGLFSNIQKLETEEVEKEKINIIKEVPRLKEDSLEVR